MREVREGGVNVVFKQVHESIDFYIFMADAL